MIVFRSASEARPLLNRVFSNLATARWSFNSPKDTGYQCIAWAACQTKRIWWPWDHPNYYWPPGFAKLPIFSSVPVAHFAEMFEKRFGYQKCDESAYEIGYQKVAIYANATGVTHMARQHFFGNRWLSKLGEEEDIIHEKTSDIEGSVNPMANTYGVASYYMRRSWLTALRTGCIFRCLWATFRFRLYRLVVPWDLK
jgi:hypothetical protein